MAQRGKQYRNAVSSLDRTALYELNDAIGHALQAAYAKFDESFDVALRLGVDPRHADQMIRSSVQLPHGTGKVVRVLVFAKGEKEKEAREAGADHVGNEEMIEKIKGGWTDFDKTIATPDMMGEVGKIGRILGPRGLMPNAKLGTVTFDVAKAVAAVKGGKVDFKVDKAGVVHAAVGKASFGLEKLRENVLAFVDRIVQLKPATSKGIYLRAISLSTTMGAGVQVDPLQVRALLKQ